jgi:hypothetical protein
MGIDANHTNPNLTVLVVTDLLIFIEGHESPHRNISNQDINQILQLIHYSMANLTLRRVFWTDQTGSVVEIKHRRRAVSGVVICTEQQRRALETLSPIPLLPAIN